MYYLNALASGRLGKSCVRDSREASTSAVRCISKCVDIHFHGKTSEIPWPPPILFEEGSIKPIFRAKITGLYMYSAYKDINV